MKNTVFFIGLPDKPDIPTDAKLCYKVKFAKKLSDIIYCTAEAIFVYSDVAGQKNDENFYRPIQLVDEMGLLNLFKDPFLFLDHNVGRSKLINPRQAEVIIGSVVKSKATPILGPGVVKKIEGKSCVVAFPKAPKQLGQDIFNCHISTLRVITHIQELT